MLLTERHDILLKYIMYILSKNRNKNPTTATLSRVLFVAWQFVKIVRADSKTCRRFMNRADVFNSSISSSRVTDFDSTTFV